MTLGFGNTSSQTLLADRFEGSDHHRVMSSRAWSGPIVASLCFSLAVAACVSACGGSDDGTTASSGGTGGINVGGSGTGASTGTGGFGADAGTGCAVVTGIGRDFKSSHPDFECTKDNPQGKYTDPYNKDCGPWDPAIVGPLGTALGADGKPVYAGGSGTPSTTGKANFDQWFHDAPGVNETKQLMFQLTKTPSGTFVYDTDRFFPLDGQLFDADSTNPDVGAFLDDDMKARNFHFTYELHTTFRYQSGNVFTFRGDDDVFVYIGGKLVVNIGGIHVPLQGKLELDTGRVELTAPLGMPDLPTTVAMGFDESIAGGVAGTIPLGLTPGEIYPMDFFFAERNCCASNFRLETNFDFVDCGIVK
jgi:fibro-slime domain-containing protein